MRIFFIILMISTMQIAHAAQVSDTELRQIAENELAVDKSIVLNPANEKGTVETSSFVLQEEVSTNRSNFDIEIGAQNYHPTGNGVLVGSAYSLDQLQAIPMGFLALQRWFGTHSQYANNIIRSALRLSIGYGSSTMRIHTSDGQVFDNVNYRFMPVSIASILDYIVPGLPIASFGLQLGAGELFAAQSGGATSLTNNAENAAFWEFGPYFRLHFTKNAFLKISYLNRKLFSNDSNVKIQRDNYSLFVGTGL